ncbi:amidohydrolase family protein [Streptomyces sp. SID14478]|uniref:amidohydrolase family protein n=1 Tax=Streptomyces sp. SID14478 TaxID=2706073 RepID=UPI0013D9D002|nr:amidohydrolase family protein [Streptomyces sp. SID14478]NEB77603.1 amidohydrolase family protein [Streptomyces sp. SID14478]
MPTPPFVDVHAHFVTDRYVEEARAAGHLHPDGMPGWPDWSPAGHLAMMDRAGIGKAMLSVSSPGTHFGQDTAARSLTRHVNEYAARLRAQHPDRFGHFASLPLPDVQGSVAEAGHALDVLGAHGLAVETNSHGIYLGNEKFEPLWEELDRHGAVVFVHPTSPPGAEDISLGRPRPMMEFLFDSARAASDLVLNGVLERRPNIRWIFTHGGGVLPLLTDRIQLFATALAKAHADTAPVRDQLARMWFDLAGTPFPRQVPALVDLVGDQHLLYGSDYCWTPADMAIEQAASIDSADQPEADTWRALTSRNARRLLESRPTASVRGVHR